MSWRAFFMLALLVLVACGKPANHAPMAGSAPPVNPELPVVEEMGVQVARLTGDDAMRYNGTRFTVHAGKPVRIELANIGHKPRDQMAHNFVLLKAGTDAMLYNLASAEAKSTGYMPPDRADSVLAYTPMVGPGQTVQVEFTAPDPGEYPYLCNFPGHFAAGMKGTMAVVP